MGVQDFLTYVSEKCPDACKTSNLSYFSQIYGKPSGGKGVDHFGRQGYSQLKLVVDAEDCLSRLYGGYYNDWVCGGGWNRMTTFIQELTNALNGANILIIPVFNGAFEQCRIRQWHEQQMKHKGHMENIFKHLGNASATDKWKPPPKVWWMAPGCLGISLRLAFRALQMTAVCSLEDHVQETMEYCREFNLHGVMSESAEYIIFQPPRLFSCMSLKMKHTGSLESLEYNVDGVARKLNLNPNRFPILAALLGNHILSPEDLNQFHCILMECDPLNSKFKFNKTHLIDSLIGFVQRLENADPEYVGSLIFRNYPFSVKTELLLKLKESVLYYVRGTKEGHDKFNLKQKDRFLRTPAAGSYPRVNPCNSGDVSSKPMSNLDFQTRPINIHNQGNIVDHFSGLSLSDTSSRTVTGHVAAPGGPPLKSPLNTISTDGEDGRTFFDRHGVAIEILREASDRHRKGFMHPWIYQVLTQGQVKMEVCLESEASELLYKAVDKFRKVRQYVYGILFNVHKYPGASEVIINEWVVRNTGLQCEQVNPLSIVLKQDGQPVDVPNCSEMWFSSSEALCHLRIRVVLACFELDPASALIDVTRVPMKHLVLCCILRFFIKERILCLFELHAFLLQALHPDLHNVDAIMNLQVPSINCRAVQLATLFMKGVEHVILANDSCGSPIPWNFTCPWYFFDGKLFQYAYQMIEKGMTISEVFNHNMKSMLELESLKKAILDGFPNPEFVELAMASHDSKVISKLVQPLDRSINALSTGHAGPFPASSFHRSPVKHGFYNQSALPTKADQRPRIGRGFGLNNRHSLDSCKSAPGSRPSLVDYRGGQLEVGGIVVSNWGANMQVASCGRGIGRGSSFFPPRPAASVAVSSASTTLPKCYYPAGMEFSANTPAVSSKKRDNKYRRDHSGSRVFNKSGYRGGRPPQTSNTTRKKKDKNNRNQSKTADVNISSTKTKSLSKTEPENNNNGASEQKTTKSCCLPDKPLEKLDLSTVIEVD